MKNLYFNVFNSDLKLVCNLGFANLQNNDFVQNIVNFPKNFKNFI